MIKKTTGIGIVAAAAVFFGAVSCSSKTETAESQDSAEQVAEDENAAQAESQVIEEEVEAEDNAVAPAAEVADPAKEQKKTADQYTVTPSGLKYKVIKKGYGKMPKATDVVEVNYEGKLLNGQVFDSSYARGESATFPLNRVIAGWTEGLQLMPEGSVYEFYIPYNLAYGERGAGRDIPPYSDLIFTVELIAVK